MAIVAVSGGGGKKTTTTTTKKTTSTTVPKTSSSKTSTSSTKTSSSSSSVSNKTGVSTPKTTTTTSTPKTTTSSSSSSNKSSSSSGVNLLTAINNAINSIKNATTSSSSTPKTTTTPTNTGSVYSAPSVSTPKVSTPAAVNTGPYVATPSVQQAVNSAPAATTPKTTSTSANTGPYLATQSTPQVSTTPKITNPTPEQIPTYDQSSTRDDVIKFIQDNNITGEAQKGVIQAANSYLDQSLAAKQALNEANIEGNVRPSNALNPYTSNALIETKYGNNGDTLVTDYRTGDQGILPSADTLKEILGSNDQSQSDNGSSGGGSYYGGGSGGGGGGSYEPVYEGSNNYYDDLMAAFMEQSAAARDAAIEAILKNLDAVKGSYKSQIEDVIAEYQKLVNQNEVAKDRARRVIRENQANRGQLDSGLGRQEQLDMNIGYDNITSNLNAARVKAVNDINNLIIQAEAEANTNKANVINNYNNALLEYRLANQG